MALRLTGSLATQAKREAAHVLEHRSNRKDSSVPGAAALRRSAPVFAALGDETRLGLLARLCSDGPLSIVRLSDGSDVTRQAITKHLHALADAGLVRDERRGRERVWQIQTKRIDDARRSLDAISQRWDDALARLKIIVEGP